MTRFPNQFTKTSFAMTEDNVTEEQIIQQS